MRFWKKKSWEHGDHNVITLKQAKHETKEWRKHYAGELGNIKAFFIPMHDLKCLIRRYKKYKPSGARAYIGLIKDAKHGNSRIRLILVPATESTDFFDKGPGAYSVADDNSSVYDFTMPCPDSCASANPLNSNPIPPSEI